MRNKNKLHQSHSPSEYYHIYKIIITNEQSLSVQMLDVTNEIVKKVEMFINTPEINTKYAFIVNLIRICRNSSDNICFYLRSTNEIHFNETDVPNEISTYIIHVDISKIYKDELIEIDNSNNTFHRTESWNDYIISEDNKYKLDVSEIKHEIRKYINNIPLPIK